MTVNPRSSYMHWPERLSDIGITEEQRKTIDGVFNLLYTHLENGEQLFPNFLKSKEDDGSSKRIFQFMDGDGNIREEHELPLTLDLRLDENRIILVAKKIIASGANNQVKAAFDLYNGLPYIKKRVFLHLESLIYQFIQNDPSRGLPAPVFFREVDDKLQIFEPRFTCSLDRSLGNGLFNDDAGIILIVRDLLEGLIKLESFEYDHPAVGKVSCFHGDVKPGNILIRGSSNCIPEVVWTDFGFSGQVDLIGGTCFFNGPEHVAMICKAYPNGFNGACAVSLEEILQYNLKNGHPRDMWGLGCSILYMLRDSPDHFPLKSIGELFNTSSLSVHQDEHLQYIQQDVITADIEEWKDECRDSPHRIKLLELAILMLQVNPEERITKTDALQFLSDL